MEASPDGEGGGLPSEGLEEAALMEDPGPQHCSSGAACKTPHDVADLELWEDLGQPDAWFCAKCWEGGGEEEPPPVKSGEPVRRVVLLHEVPSSTQHEEKGRSTTPHEEKDQLMEKPTQDQHMDKKVEEAVKKQHKMTEQQKNEWAQKMMMTRQDKLKKWKKNGLGPFRG